MPDRRRRSTGGRSAGRRPRRRVRFGDGLIQADQPVGGSLALRSGAMTISSSAVQPGGVGHEDHGAGLAEGLDHGGGDHAAGCRRATAPASRRPRSGRRAASRSSPRPAGSRLRAVAVGGEQLGHQPAQPHGIEGGARGNPPASGRAVQWSIRCCVPGWNIGSRLRAASRASGRAGDRDWQRKRKTFAVRCQAGPARDLRGSSARLRGAQPMRVRIKTWLPAAVGAHWPVGARRCGGCGPVQTGCQPPPPPCVLPASAPAASAARRRTAARSPAAAYRGGGGNLNVNVNVNVNANANASASPRAARGSTRRRRWRHLRRRWRRRPTSASNSPIPPSSRA